MIEKNVVIDILKRIESLLLNDSSYEAREYIKIEIDNFEGITPKKCKNTKYYYYFCDKCSNENCPDNKLDFSTKTKK